MDPNIQDYLNNIIAHSNNIPMTDQDFYAKDYFSPSPKSMSFPSSSLDDPLSDGLMNDHDMLTSVDYNPVNNANLLRDIESLIHNMEKKQSQGNDNATMLQNIDSILSNIKLNESRPHSPQSNLSAEPIRMKSPIMFKTTRNGTDEKVASSRGIIDDVRNFVSNNIQDIIPDLVGQVKYELTATDNEDEFHDAMELNDYFRDRETAEFDEINSQSPILRVIDDLLESQLNDFLRNRHEVEFTERNQATPNPKDDSDVDQHQLDFFAQRYEEEYQDAVQNQEELLIEEKAESVEREVAVMDEVLIGNEAQESSNSVNQERSEAVAEVVDTNSQQEAPALDEIQAPQSLIPLTDSSEQAEILTQAQEPVQLMEQPEQLPASPPQTLETEIPQQESQASTQVHTTTSNPLHDLEPLKYKSSYNLKILKKAKRSKKDQDFKKRNSLVLASILLGRDITADSPTNRRPLSLIENDINHENLIDTESNQTEINSTSIIDSNGQSEQEQVHESLMPMSEIYIEHSDISTSGMDTLTSTTPIPQSSSNMSITTIDSDATFSAIPKMPQNLSELVEDTQRLIKQMKDEINAIYVSDENSSGSEYSAENWVDDFDDGEDLNDEGEFFEDEESEYEDWSGNEYADIETANDATVIEGPKALRSDINIIVTADETAEPIMMIGNSPNEQSATVQSSHNDNDNADSRVVHGKLELTVLSNNEVKVDTASAESDDENEGNEAATTNNQISGAVIYLKSRSVSPAANGTSNNEEIGSNSKVQAVNAEGFSKGNRRSGSSSRGGKFKRKGKNLKRSTTPVSSVHAEEYQGTEDVPANMPSGANNQTEGVTEIVETVSEVVDRAAENVQEQVESIHEDTVENVQPQIEVNHSNGESDNQHAASSTEIESVAINEQHETGSNENQQHPAQDSDRQKSTVQEPNNSVQIENDGSENLAPENTQDEQTSSQHEASIDDDNAKEPAENSLRTEPIIQNDTNLPENNEEIATSSNDSKENQEPTESHQQQKTQKTAQEVTNSSTPLDLHPSTSLQPQSSSSSSSSSTRSSSEVDSRADSKNSGQTLSTPSSSSLSSTPATSPAPMKRKIGSNRSKSSSETDSSSSAPSTHSEGIKAIVNEAINDVISTISFENIENAVAVVNLPQDDNKTDNHPQIARSDDNDAANIDSVMNNSLPDVTTTVLGSDKKSVSTENDVSPVASDDKNQSKGTTSKGTLPKSRIPSKVKILKSKEISQTTVVASEATEKDKRKPISRKNSVDNDSSKKDGPLRKKSVGSPFGGLVSSTVKNLQKEFLNKAATSTAPKPQVTKLKTPSKLAMPKTLTKEPPQTFANKLTKLITPSSSIVKDDDYAVDKNKTDDGAQQPRDYSKDVVPKKKYMEHCFSDEYSTTTDDEDDDVKMSSQRDIFVVAKPKPASISDDETSDVSWFMTNGNFLGNELYH